MMICLERKTILRIECLSSTEVDFSSSSRNLIRIGFNLYNGYMDEIMNPLWIFASQLALY